MSQNKLEDICVYYHVARNERKNDLANNRGKKGTMGFEDMGCYNNCDGHNKECVSYINTLELYGKGLNNG